jgi:competence protein ComEA
MEKTKNIGLIAAAAIAILAVAGYFAPHHSASSAGPAIESATATVPPQLATIPSQSSPDVSSSIAPRATRAVVYVCGLVKHPGIYEMAPGSRVADGIDRAGGALADADLEQLNLAEPVADAMKIDVPRKGEHPAFAAALDAPPASSGTSLTHRRRGGRSSHKLQQGQTLDVNTASETELTQLPGVGPSLAARIMEYRTENGPFQSIDDLQNVSGIGPSKFDKMAPYVRL